MRAYIQMYAVYICAWLFSIAWCQWWAERIWV